MVLRTIAFKALCAASIALVAACAAPPASRQSFAAASYESIPSEAELRAPEIAALTTSLRALSSDIDPKEAARAARVSYEYVAQLRHEYQITDGPLLHNYKVNEGLKPRGLCWHWATDIEKRLNAEDFKTLDVHRAIANYDSLRLEHSTTILSAKGASMFDGILLDPWRKGGDLTWMPVRDDTRYNWTPRDEVFAWKRARGLLTTQYVETARGDETRALAQR